MDQKTVAFARSWARRYVRTKHPHGLDEEDVENRILEALHYNKDKRRALSWALNDIQDNLWGQAPKRTSFLPRFCSDLARYLPRGGRETMQSHLWSRL